MRYNTPDHKQLVGVARLELYFSLYICRYIFLVCRIVVIGHPGGIL